MSTENPQQIVQTEVQSRISPEIRYFPGNGTWLASWKDSRLNPTQYFNEAQNFIDSLAKDQSFAGKKRHGLYFQNARTIIPNPTVIDMERFEAPPEWETDEIRMAQFTFEKASFCWERGELTVSSHYNSPQEFTDFIVSHANGKVDVEQLVEKLGEVGALAQARQAELASQTQET